jgi:DmsE family decaheme c-type cytochrome
MSIITMFTVVAGLGVALVQSSLQDSAPVRPDRPDRLIRPLAAHQAPTLAAAVPDDVTKETCAACHEDQVASFDRSEHRHAMAGTGAECSSCHGDATAHVEAGGGQETMTHPRRELSAQQQSELCLYCHEKAGEQAHTRLGEHTRAGVSCIDCHETHPSERTAQVAHRSGKGAMVPATSDACLRCHSQVAAEFSLPSRHRLHEGAMDCSSCHNVHGSTSDRQLRNEGKDQCLTCHQDKRGPFMFEHLAGALDGCVSCHAPHGSAGRHMLKERDPRALCLSCHSREMGKGVPHGRASNTTMGDCTRCHTAVHGSNVDPFLLH